MNKNTNASRFLARNKKCSQDRQVHTDPVRGLGPAREPQTLDMLLDSPSHACATLCSAHLPGWLFPNYDAVLLPVHGKQFWLQLRHYSLFYRADLTLGQLLPTAHCQPVWISGVLGTLNRLISKVTLQDRHVGHLSAR